MNKPTHAMVLISFALVTSMLLTAESKAAPPILAAGSDYSGIVCLAFSPEGDLWVSEGFRNEIMRMDARSGEVLESFSENVASAADMIFADDGTMYWVNAFIGEVWQKPPGGPARMLADFDVVIDGLALHPDGRLFTASFCHFRATWEIFHQGLEGHRMIADIGGFDAFDIGPDGFLYGPEFQDGTGNILRLDVDTGEAEILCGGFLAPSSLRFSPDGVLHVLDSAAAQIVAVDLVTAEKTVVANIPHGGDNFAFSPDGEIYIAFISDAFVGRVARGGQTIALTRPGISCPGGISVRSNARGHDTLFVTDAFSIRRMNAQSGQLLDSIYPGPTIAPFSLYDDGRYLITSNSMFSQVQVIDPDTLATIEIHFDHLQPLNAIRYQGEIVVAELGTGSVVSAVDHSPLIDGLETPVGLAASQNDDLYVGDWSSGIIWQAFEAGAQLQPPRLVARGLDRPEGITVDHDDNLLVVEVGRRRLLRIDVSSGLSTVITEDLDVGLPASPGLAPPGLAVSSVAIADNGVIYVTGDYGNLIYRIRPDRPMREPRARGSRY